MIAVDTSTFIAYFEGASGSDVELLDGYLSSKQVVLAPIVLTELLSDSAIPPEVAEFFLKLPLLEVLTGYWERAGRIRAKILRKGNKARIADALIVQICLDHKLPLLSRDRDFKAFARHCHLPLIV
jgi:predicted nucleic acid-binding protein